jgi:hypothetical protein
VVLSDHLEAVLLGKKFYDEFVERASFHVFQTGIPNGLAQQTLIAGLLVESDHLPSYIEMEFG